MNTIKNIRKILLVLVGVLVFAGKIWGQFSFSPSDLNQICKYGDAPYTHKITHPPTVNGTVFYPQYSTLPPGITNFKDDSNGTCSFDIDPKVIGSTAPGNISFNFDATDGPIKQTFTFSLTVNRATLTATAQNTSRPYGAPNPAFTISYTGFVYGDDQYNVNLTPPAASCTATPASNVGTYPITLSGGSANHYTFSLANGTLTVTQAGQTISNLSNITRTYGDPAYPLSASASSGLPVTYTSSNTSVATISGNMITITGVGTSTITANQAGNANYLAAPPATATLTVNQASQTISNFSNITRIYGDPAFTLSASASSGLPVTYTSSNTSVATISGNTVTITGAGTSTITANQTGNANYLAASATATLTVSKASQTILYLSNITRTYGDPDFTLPATASSGLPVVYTSSNTSVATISGNTVSIKGAGTSIITANQAGDANYNAAPSINVTLNVNQANIPSAHITVTAPATGAMPNTVATGSGNFSIGPVIWLPAHTTFQSGQKYTASITLSALSGYTFTGIAATNVTINGYNATITGTPGASLTIEYEFSPTSLTTIPSVAINIDAPVTYNTPATIAVGTGNFTIGAVSWMDNDDPFKGNKMYTATVTLTANTSYSFTGSTSATINGQVAMIINNSGSSLTLSRTFPATTRLTQNALTIVNPGQKKFGDPAFSLTTAGGSGSGAITFTLVSGPGTVSSSGLVTIAGAGNITVRATKAADDYYLSATSAELTIVVVKADPPVIAWPAANPVTYNPDLQLSSVTFSPTDFKTGDVTLGYFSWTTPATALTAAGTSNQSMTLFLTQPATDNYNFAGAAVTGSVPVTVNKATPTVTLNPMPTGNMYGGALFRIDSYANSESPADIKFRMLTAPPAAVDVDEFGNVIINHAGSVQIQAYVEESDNYLAATSQTRTLTIVPANLYVIVENYKLQYMQPIPPVFPVRYDGFINGDDASILIGDLEFSILPTSDPKFSDIIASGVSGLPDYTVHFVKGILERTDRPVLTATVAPVIRPYGDDNPEFTIIYTGFIGNDNMNNYTIKTPPVATCYATRYSLPRDTEWTIRLTGGEDDTYLIQTVNSTLTVVKAILTVTADNKFRYVGQNNPDLTFEYSGFKNEEDESIFEPEQLPNIMTTATSGSLAGNYTITFTEVDVEDNPRYEFRYIPGILTVWEAGITKTYGTDSFVIPVTSGVEFTMRDVSMSISGIINLVMNDDNELIATVIKNGATNITITVSPRITIPVIIEKATLTVRAKDVTREQGKSNPPSFEIIYSGFAYEEDESVLLSLPYAVCDARSWDSPGTHDIRVAGGDASNYIIEHVWGKLTILPSRKLPTAFIPNGGSFNNTIWPWPESEYKVQIHNRLGVLLYSGNNGWDGKYKGNYVQPGVYYYYATSPEGVVYSGSVEVIKTK